MTLLLQILNPLPTNLGEKKKINLKTLKSKIKVYFSFRKKTGKYIHEYLSYTSDKCVVSFLCVVPTTAWHFEIT